MVKEVRTSDVFEASYYRAEGLELIAMEASADLPARSECVFVLSGEETLIEALSTQYLTGRATVNVIKFKRFYWDSCQNLRGAKKKLRAPGGDR